MTPKTTPQVRPRRTTGRPVRRSLLRDAARTYLSVPFGWVVTFYGLTVTLTGAVAHTTGYAVVPASIAVATGLFLMDLTLRFPSIAATTGVVVIASLFAGPFGFIYSLAATAGNPDPAGALVTTIVLFALTGILAHRTSHGRPWVTTLLLVAAFLTVGPYLLTLAPWFGFGWVWALMTLVLVLRGGGTRWLTARWRTFRAPAPTDPAAALPATGETAAVGAEANDRTDPHLADLPDGYTHEPSGTGRVVIGPTGVFWIESRQVHGHIHEDLHRGLVHGKTSLAGTLHAAATHASDLSTRIGVEVNTVVVIHDATLPAPCSRVELSAGNRGHGVVTVLAPTSLHATLTDGPATLSRRQIRRITSKATRTVAVSSA